jgi:ankyrin repeat protein
MRRVNGSALLHVEGTKPPGHDPKTSSLIYILQEVKFKSYIFLSKISSNLGEMATDLSPFSGLKKPYQAALNGDWEAMKSFYDKHPEHVVRPLTIDGLTAFHIAGYNSKGTELLQHLLGLLPPSDISLAISKKSYHENNVFHEVASTNNVESAKLLITTLSGNNLPELKKILEDRNQIGETPLFRAAALGQTKMAKFLAKLVGDLGEISPHLHRYDSMSILHAAVLGQHFGLSLALYHANI